MEIVQSVSLGICFPLINPEVENYIIHEVSAGQQEIEYKLWCNILLTVYFINFYKDLDHRVDLMMV